jgi:hypothetical protein
MNDCSNAEIRDQLPDLLHDRLVVGMRDMVVAHVSDCVDCREELELLRGVQQVLVTETPRIDITQIVAALPRPSVARPARTPARRMMRMDWRIAAAVTFLAVGGSSVALLNRAPATAGAFSDSGSVVASAATTVAAVPSSSASNASSSASDETVADAQAAADVSPGGRFSGLTDAQLQALIGDIGDLPAVPVTEPDPVAIRVVNSAAAAPEGL